MTAKVDTHNPRRRHSVATDPESRAAAALSRGDFEGAIASLVEDYGDAILRHCTHVLGDVALAEDTHQTIFLQAYRGLPNFSGDSTFRTWLFAITRHRCLDACKSRRRFRRRFQLTDAAPERADSGDLTKRLARARAIAALIDGLARLKPEARIAVLLRYREGLTYQEMSSVCGERPAALQARVSRAIVKLRKYLGGRDVL